jgi:hypothetical protein
MKFLPTILLCLCFATPALAQEPLVVLALPDSVKQIAETNQALRIELRQGLTRLWGMDTNSPAQQAWADMGWIKCTNASGTTGWVYVVTEKQTGYRLDDDTLFTRWRVRVRQLGGELWRDLKVWTESGWRAVSTPLKKETP